MNILLSLNRALTIFPEREALVEGDRRFTYRQFGERVTRLARTLEMRGVASGRLVSIIAPKGHEFMEAYYACALLGAVLNPINFRLSPAEIAHILQDCRSTVLLAHIDFLQAVKVALENCQTVRQVIWLRTDKSPALDQDSCGFEEALAECNGAAPVHPQPTADALAHLYYTSGTTGKPKGVMLTHGNVTFHALAAIAELSLTDSDTWVHVAPMFHLADAWATFAVTAVGGKHVFVPYFQSSQVLETIERERITITNLIPTMLNAMINDPSVKEHDYTSLRVLLSGGAPIAPDMVRRIISTFGCDYVQTYGMTETSPYLTVSLLKAHLRGLPMDKQLEIKSRTGRPLLGVELKVVRADGTEVAKDNQEVGEIIVRGPTVTPGYWNQPEATAESIQDGWLHTGDLAVIDDEGYVNIVDRKKDMILTGGENVYSTEVEHVLYEHPGVLECAVIAVPDPTWGEAVKAVVVPRTADPPAEAELIAFVKERIAHYKAPRSIDFVSELPKTGSGKIYKRALKDRYGSGS